jgi:hypothetical protein
MKNDRMSAANKGVLSTARTEEGSKILTRSQKEPSTKVPGFLLLGANKIYFDWRIKQKRRELRQQFGFYAWIEQIREDVKS